MSRPNTINKIYLSLEQVTKTLFADKLLDWKNSEYTYRQYCGTKKVIIHEKILYNLFMEVFSNISFYDIDVFVTKVLDACEDNKKKFYVSSNRYTGRPSSSIAINVDEQLCNILNSKDITLSISDNISKMLPDNSKTKLQELLKHPEFESTDYLKIKRFLDELINRENLLCYSLAAFILFCVSVSRNKLESSIIQHHDTDFITKLANRPHRHNTEAFLMDEEYASFVKSNKPFNDEQYRKFSIYLYNDVEGSQEESHLCSGEICLNEDASVQLDIRDGELTIQYTGHASINNENKLVYIILSQVDTNRGAILCFHYHHFNPPSELCILRQGLFVNTASSGEHFRPTIRKILLMHEQVSDMPLIEGMLKVADMRDNDPIILLKKNNLSKFYYRIKNLKLSPRVNINYGSLNTAITSLQTETYYIIQELSFDTHLKNAQELHDLDRKRIILTLKSVSELPNSIYLYSVPEQLYRLFKNDLDTEQKNPSESSSLLDIPKEMSQETQEIEFDNCCQKSTSATGDASPIKIQKIEEGQRASWNITTIQIPQNNENSVSHQATDTKEKSDLWNNMIHELLSEDELTSISDFSSEDDVVRYFQNSTPTLNYTVSKSNITIYLLSEEKRGVCINQFPTSTYYENKNKFTSICLHAYVLTLSLFDRIYPKEKNPLRQSPNKYTLFIGAIENEAKGFFY